MKEQLFCSKCGKTERSRYFETCECREPDFKFESYDDFLEQKKKPLNPTDKGFSLASYIPS